MRTSARGALPTLAILAALSAACTRPEARAEARAEGAADSDTHAASAPARVVVHELMADPAAVPDGRGEWLELRNLGDAPVELRGWRLRSGNDRGYEIATSLVVPPEGLVVLARNGDASRNGGVRASLAYGSAISLANGGDWLALAGPDGATVDSVAWSRVPRGAAIGVRDAGLPHANVGDANWVEQTTTYGAGDRGTPGAPNDGALPPTAGGPVAPEPVVPGPVAPVAPGTPNALTVRVLDVGQGDAVLISNGTNTALVDGGPDPRRLGRLLDSLGLRDTTIDVVVLTHPHYDHHSGLRALFDSRRRILVRYFFEARDPYANQALAELRDSMAARIRRDGMVLRDADDPCGNGRPICTITMNGGARLHVMRPIPRADGVNDRSVP
ncbi:MAG TPA: lamin tail domain-containing protein, partial [Gemmatimonadales bacterium]